MRAALFVVAIVLAVLGASKASDAALERAPRQAVPAVLKDLWIGNLGPAPADPGNRWADDGRAAEWGHRLFFDTRLSSNGEVSCASCHDPRKDFQDSLPLAKGVGTTDRRTMPVAGTAHSPFLFWDGRKDSLWGQALGPLESPVEHGGSRAQYAHVVWRHYRNEYEALFGPMPDLSRVPAVGGPVADVRARAAWEAMAPVDRDAVTRVFANVGKAIAAYERRIQPGASRFDAYVAAWERDGAPPSGVLTADEVAGMNLFAGKANCVQCHNGPLLTNNEFHNTGVPARAGLPADRGRILAASAVKADEFNCRSRWSDAKADECVELAALPKPSHVMERAYKVPSLRNVASRAPYMHAGQLETLAQVVRHYNTAPAAPAGHSEIVPLGLTSQETRQLEAFLRALDGGLSGPPRLLAAP